MPEERPSNQNSTNTCKLKQTQDKDKPKQLTWRERFTEVMRRKQFQESAMEIVTKLSTVASRQENKTIEIDAISVEDLSHISPIDAAILATRNHNHINKLKMLRE